MNVALALLLGCRIEVGAPAGGAAVDAGLGTSEHPVEVWIYTSMYQEVLDALTPDLTAALPGVRVQWFQAGSEKVAQRWEAETEAGGSRACLLATSDPGWYEDLARRGALRAYVSPRALELPRAWVRPTHAAFRVSLMVLAANGEAPPSFAALAEPAWKGRFSTPDPLSSGTMFTTLAALEHTLGDAWLASARGNGWVAAGGNSAVVARMQSGEAPVGVVLLENLLAQEGYAEGTPGVARPNLAAGAIPVPGPIAITTGCTAPAAAEAVEDWLLSPVAQAHIVAGRMHSPFPGAPAPAHAPALADVELLPLPDDFAARTATRANALRARWNELGG